MAVVFELIIFQLGLADMVLSYKQERDKAMHMAFRDQLTGAYNRHGLNELLYNRRSKIKPSNIALIDIDHFKVVNDDYGHNVGDECLVSVVEVIKKQLREEDKIIRYGGEEFLVFIQDTSLDKAHEICERIRTAMHLVQVPHSKGHTSFTVSIGLACIEHNEPVKSVIQRADIALYKSKDNGRDQITIAS